MVELALAGLGERCIVHLDEECKAAMVTNLMVVLCGDQLPAPIVNAGRQLVLRIDPAVHDALARWASDELRNVNA